MDTYNIYKDIQARTNGEIYIGVVGPVRTGKSTFVRRFMELAALPNMEETQRNEVRDPSSVEVLGKFRRFHFLFFLLLSLIFDFPFIYAKFSNALLGLFLLKNFWYML